MYNRPDRYCIGYLFGLLLFSVGVYYLSTGIHEKMNHNHYTSEICQITNNTVTEFKNGHVLMCEYESYPYSDWIQTEKIGI